MYISSLTSTKQSGFYCEMFNNNKHCNDFVTTGKSTYTLK